MKDLIKTKRWVAGIVFALSGIIAGGALAGIMATKHNLSTTGTGTVKSTDQTEICIFCHTPHDAIKNDNIPLWNHTLSTQGSYGIYTSPTYNATDTANLGGVVEATAAVSNLCLSCHDGTVAINAFKNPSNINPTTTMVGTTAVTGTLLSTSSTNLGTDLKNDHPVNFTYNTALATADGSLVNPVDATGSGLSNGVKLYSSKVQCASCHDPHTSAQGAFLRTAMTQSQLCFSCHSK